MESAIKEARCKAFEASRSLSHSTLDDWIMTDCVLTAQHLPPLLLIGQTKASTWISLSSDTRALRQGSRQLPATWSLKVAFSSRSVAYWDTNTSLCLRLLSLIAGVVVALRRDGAKLYYRLTIVLSEVVGWSGVGHPIAPLKIVHGINVYDDETSLESE